MQRLHLPAATVKSQVTGVLLSALSCTSCATAGQITLPAANVAEKAATWPPLAVDGYTTNDDQHHPLNGGHMIADGDSITFISPVPAYGNRLGSPYKENETLHRDSVRTVDVRLSGHSGSQVGAFVGGVLIGLLTIVLLLYGPRFR